MLIPYHTTVCVCIGKGRGVRICMCICVCCQHSLCPVYFSSATLCLPSTTLAIPSQPTHTGREWVDQWSRVPTGTVVEQIASTAAVMNATGVHNLQRTTPNRLSCPALTPCVSSQSPWTILGAYYWMAHCDDESLCVHRTLSSRADRSTTGTDLDSPNFDFDFT